MPVFGFPTEDVTFRQVLHATQTKYVKQVSAVVHAVRDYVCDGCAETLLLRRVIQVVIPHFVPAARISDMAGNCIQLLFRDGESADHTRDRLVLRSFELRSLRHQRRPDFHVVNDMVQRLANRSVTDVKILV